MPYSEVFNKFGKGALHSGSKAGPVVKNHAQAVAIFLSEKRAAAKGKKEYRPKLASVERLKV
jgi:hypothetical protein